MKCLIERMVFLLCLVLIANSYAAEKKALEIKGKVIMVELEPSADPKNPNFWPCLSIQGKENMLVGKPDILKELSYLAGKEVVLQAKQLPNQKFAEKEYGCFEINEIEKMNGREYLSSRKAIDEFKRVARERDVVDETGKQKISGALKSIWFDKNANGVIDSTDRLFMVNRTAGTANGKYLLYASQAIVRGKDKNIYYDTFILEDPVPENTNPAVMGRLKYNTEKDSYSVEVNKICPKGEDALRAPKEEEKIVFIEGDKGRLKLFAGKTVLLSGEKIKNDAGKIILEYDTMLWQSDAEEEISRVAGQYLIIKKGKVSIVEQAVQEPWKLSLVLLKDSAGNSYELRQVGYAGFWKDFLDKEVKVTGLLRPLTYYDRPTCVIEVTRIED